MPIFQLPLPDGRVLSSQARPLIMGILNVTPDSFSDGGLFAAHDAAIAQGERLAEEGADIIDIGGESTRPGHQPVAEDEEGRRVLPVVEALAKRVKQPLSIDTMKASVARRALDAGAVILNDVWGLRHDPEMPNIARRAAALVVMHNRREIDASIDMVAEVKSFLAGSLALGEAAGVAKERILVDPGIGFGKTRAQNLILLRRLGELSELGAPILVGLSRKSLIGHVTGELTPRERLFGTIAANVLAARAGASVLRVHDVKAHLQALAVASAIAAAA
ncbi:MAG: dihydropteroate synthase [Hyphomicrobiales bacterium]|nr:dihydropteroate synthase [Hyphomicrobiales bacterium]MBV9520390.1 dihydropteroate synthase [Hyphomicrobiales bacterium]